MTQRGGFGPRSYTYTPMKYLRMRADGSVHTYNEGLTRFAPVDEFECEPEALPESGFIEDLMVFMLAQQSGEMPKTGRIKKIKLEGADA